jgi:hypothetical protein
MHGNIPFALDNARNVAATSCQQSFIQPASGNILPPEKWFMRIAHSLWGGAENSPAKWLRYFTGFPERTCRSAASGDTDPSGAMLYVLLRSDAGRDILAGIMDGSSAEWWHELCVAADVGRGAMERMPSR